MAPLSKKLKESVINETPEPIDIPEVVSTIAEIAYYKAESRNFEPGAELNDWLEAEQEYLQSRRSV
jgi:hypothetical protein